VTNPRYSLTRFAERALADISRWRGDHVAVTRPGRFTPGRHIAEVLERRHQSTLSGVVSCVEVYATDLLQDLQPAISEQEVSTWREREKAWRQHLHLTLADLQIWPALCGFVAARNAIQHGLGALTNMQLGISADKPRNYNYREDTLSVLRAAKMRLDADRVIVGADDVGRCISTANAFVRELDAQAYAAQHI
jgi:hypothetical protein